MSSQIEETHFIEDIGLFFERLGLPRIAGRIVGFLLISDPQAQSLNDIQDALQVSKSSVSTMSRLLVHSGLVEQVPSTLPRRDFFRFKPGGWAEFMRQRMEIMAGLHAIADAGLRLLADKPPELRARLEEAHEVFEFVDKEFPAWLEKMKEKKRHR